MDQYKTDNISIRGYSHYLSQKECQDSSKSWQTRYYDAIIVCDGHGGEKYIRSSTGSSFACDIGSKIIDEFMRHLCNGDISLTDKNHDDILRRLERAIVQEWRMQVSADSEANPIDQDPRFSLLSDADKKSLLNNSVKAYGTTFLAAVMSEKDLFIIQLGDGNACVVKSNLEVILPECLQDEQLQFNLTTSLCNSDADMQFRHYYKHLINGQKSIAGVFLSSDGLINCYRSCEAYESLVKNIFLSYGEVQRKDAKEELRGVLHTLSQKGSGDDLSIALICCPKLIKDR